MDLWDRALGFMDSQVLLMAEEVGVFRALAQGPLSAQQVAAATGLPLDPAERLLDALAAMDLLQRRDGAFTNRPELVEHLVPGGPQYLGGMFRYLRESLYPLWQHFGAALCEGIPQWGRLTGREGQPSEQLFEDPVALRAFLDGMHAITFHAASELAAVTPELRELRSITDLGGASGAFVIALAQANPRLQGCVYDLPAVRPVAEDYFRSSGLVDRLRFHPADFWKDPLPPGADAYSLGFILHDWDTQGGTFLLQKIASALRPGGLLIVGEHLWNDDRSGPAWVARSDLNMLVAARGRERSARQYREWIEPLGYRVERVQPTSRGKQFIFARRVEA
jgi:SAM-dependent methyltransferase